MWPFSTIRRLRGEVRGYSDALTASLIARAGGGEAPTGQAAQTACVEAAAAMYARAFACAAVEPEVPALSPELLATVARSLIVAGESLHVIEVRDAEVRLVPCGSWEVVGESSDPSTWTYRCNLDGPSASRTVDVPSAGVVHVRYAIDPSRPWRGVGPLGRATLTADALSAVETRIGQEAAATSAYVVPTPVGGQEAATSTLRSDLKAARGGVLLVETMAGGFGDKAAAPQGDWGQKRIGGEPPEVLRLIRTDAGRDVLAACGVPVSLVTDADGTSQRESWRRFAAGSVLPLARLFEAEVADKLELDVRLDFAGLYAHDLQGRASAFQRMVAGGMDAAEAATLSGLVIPDA